MTPALPSRYIHPMPDPYAFRNRAKEVSRLEAFSDIVFGFALTLIVVALEVPASFGELLDAMRGFLGFAICFAVLTWVWFCHYTFFRRYNLSDGVTIVLNTVLLFLVLFYTYPLKFIFSLVTGTMRYQDAVGSWQDAVTLFLIYGLGFAGIFTLLFFLYANAYRQREELELNELEVHDTRTNMIMYASYVLLGLLSAIVAIISPRLIPWAGWMYFLLGPVSAVIGYSRGLKRARLQEQIRFRTEFLPEPSTP